MVRHPQARTEDLNVFSHEAQRECNRQGRKVIPGTVLMFAAERAFDVAYEIIPPADTDPQAQAFRTAAEALFSGDQQLGGIAVLLPVNPTEKLRWELGWGLTVVQTQYPALFWDGPRYLVEGRWQATDFSEAPKFASHHASLIRMALKDPASIRVNTKSRKELFLPYDELEKEMMTRQLGGSNN